MQEFDCLNPASEITGHHFLEASAGTGKTFAIEHIVLRLLCEKGYALSEILAVTFTKAAARDLKGRILSTIRNAHTLLSEGKEHPFLTIHTLPALETALATVQDLQVYTLHGFCYQALSKNAVDIGFPLHASSPDEMSHTHHVVQALRDFFRTQIQPPLFSGMQFSLLLKKYDLQALEQKLLPLVTGFTEVPEGVWYEVYEAKITSLLSHIDREKVAQDAEMLAPYYKNICTRDGTIKEEFAEQIAFLRNGEDIEKTLRWKKLLFPFFSKENEKVKGPPFRSSELEVLAQEWGPIFSEMVHPTSIFCTLAHEAKKWVQTILGKGEVITPDGILECMWEATKSPLFAERVRERYRAAIIDEFQDTDPMQWEIFQTLFLSEEYKIPTFYLVGDPKQSIYSFRNADIYTYLRARDSFSQLGVLSTNYRSSRDVIDGVNALFSHPLVKQLPVPYIPVKVGAEYDPIQDGKKGVHVLRGQEEDFLPYIANELIALQHFGSCAVLVRDRFQAERVRETLLHAGIPSVMRHQGVLTDSLVFSLMKHIIAVARDPFAMNEIKLLAIHPLVGFTAQDILSEGWKDVVRRFQQLHVLFKEKGVTKTIDACMHMEMKTGTPLEKLAGGMQIDLWGDYLALMRLFFSGYSVEELERLGKKGDERVVKRPIPKENAVTIMTMHLSKGLEFDVVFALGAASRFAPKDPLVRHGNKMVKNEGGKESLEAFEEMQKEKLRQLYVALTRAKRRLYIPIIEETPPKTPFEVSPIELFMNGATEAILSSISGVISCETLTTQSIQRAILEPLFEEETEFLDTSSVKKENALSFSALSRPNVSHIGEISKEEIPPGSETGTFFHEIYERIVEEALYYPYDDTKIEELVRKKGEYTPLEPYVEKITQIFRTSFHTELLPGVRLIDIPPEQMLPEVEFFYTQQGVTYKGVIDLLFCVKGKWYVLDWKTTLLSEYSIEAIAQGMKEHDYFLQAEMYAHAAREFATDFGGVYYLFLRGLDTGKGVFYYEA